MVNEQSRNNPETIIGQSLDNHWTLVKFLQNHKAFIIRYLRKVYFFTFSILPKLFVNLFHHIKTLFPVGKNVRFLSRSSEGYC